MAAIGVLAIVAVAVPAFAQTVETDPLQCWWRTSVAAVRVGQPFSLVLTCAVIETDTVKVVPDQAPLDPAVTQLPPFEVLGGTHPADLQTGDRRFFQYEYRMRIVTEDAFGKDVRLPETRISYHLQSRTGDAPSIEGRELSYVLPPMSVRVLSLVPNNETDIRDASSGTFGDVESRAFRADLLRTLAGVFFGLAGLAVVVAAARLLGRYRADGAVNAQMVPDLAILRQVDRELSAVRRERRATEWTSVLVDRLMTALRIAAAYALSRPVIQVPVGSPPGEPSATLRGRHVTQQPLSSVAGHDGHLIVETGWMRGTRVVVAGLVTAETIRQQRALAPAGGPDRDARAALLEDLEHALDRVTLMQYGREPRVEDHELDDALEVGERSVRRLTAKHTWLGKKIAALDHFRSPLRARAWMR